VGIDREFKVIGTRPIRPDAYDKVMGRAKFGADVQLSDALVGKVLRSPYAHARIVKIETDAARQLPGVEAVVTASDFPHLDPHGIGDISRDNLANEKVLYHGHGVAAVAARTAALAEAALELIKVEYEVLPPVMSLDEAMKDEVVLHEHLRTAGGADSDRPSNIYQKVVESIGDVENGFVEADVVLEREYITPTVHQGYIEPPACLAQFSATGQSTIWTTTQGHFVIRQGVARMLQMDQSQLKVIPTEIGGGFGGKTAPYQEAIALMLSRQANLPVKMVMSREDTFRAAGPGAGSKIQMKVGATSGGRITAMQATLFYESGAFPAAPLGGGMRSIFACYDVPNQHAEGYAVVLNKPKIRAYRGPGASQSTFATESIVSELADKLVIDQIDFRLNNAVSEGAKNLGGSHPEIGMIECLQAAKASDHYQSQLGKGLGRGVAVGFWRNGGNVSSANIHLNSDGTASVSTGSTDLSGSRIALAMMVAEALEIPVDRVSIQVADTESVGFTSTSGGSRTINATGRAVVEAAGDVITEMKQRAASTWNITPDQVEWQEGHAIDTVRGDSKSMKEICREAPQTGGPIAANASLNATPGESPAFAVHICDMAVDEETGLCQVKRYTTVQDVGRAIHPGFVEGQMQGGAVQGIGWALNEEYLFNEDGVLENPGFLDYRIPLASDLPMIETIIVEVPSPSHPYGVRGVGEVPIIPPLGAIGAAVSQAIGVPITELPCAPHRVLAICKNRSAN